MSDVGSGLPVFQGTWADGAYLRGELVLRSGVLYQAATNTRSQPGGTADISGKGNPGAWVDVTALVLDFTGSVDPTAGAGIPTAIGSTYHYSGTGLYVKTASGATAWTDAAGGGGSTIAATDTQIVYMDGTDPVGSDNLTLVIADTLVTLGLNSAENAQAHIVALGAGTQLFVTAADAAPDDIGGELTLASGASDTGDGGQLNILAGNAQGNEGNGGDGGAVVIESGRSPDGQSGEIDIRVGGSVDSHKGGGINIVAGNGTALRGGSVTIQAGSKSTGGTHGSVQIYEGSGGSAILNTTGLSVSAGLAVSGLPSSDPGVAGQFYTDGAPSAGVPKALMVSGG